MSIWQRIFGAPEATKDLINMAKDGLDALVYTDEEKANDDRAERSEARLMVIDWLKATSGQNIARRALAFMIAFTWLGMFLTSMLGDMAMPWLSDPQVAANVAASSKAIGDRAEAMTGAMMLILGFYFAAPHLDKVVDAALAKFSKNKSI